MNKESVLRETKFLLSWSFSFFFLSFLLNETISISLKLNQQKLCEKSSLLKGLLENCKLQNDQPIKLQLENPQKFSIFLEYFQTEKIPKELSSYQTFVLYINDIIYLGIDELESHVIKIFLNAISQQKCDEIDFSDFRPNYDFLEHLMCETQNADNFQRCKILMCWVGDQNIDRKQIEGLTQYIQFEKLKFDQITQLAKDFQGSFDVVMKPSSLLTNEFRSQSFSCYNCGTICHQDNCYCQNCADRMRQYGGW